MLINALRAAFVKYSESGSVEKLMLNEDVCLIPDRDAARIVSSQGNIFVGVRGVGAKPQRPFVPRAVDIGWAQVLIPAKECGRPTRLVFRDGGSWYARATWEKDGKQRSLQLRIRCEADPASDEFCAEYVAACGVPLLRDFEARLRALDGGDLCATAELSALRRATRKGIEYTMESGWFLKMYREQGGLCAISKLPMYREGGKLCHKMPVPDRIDPLEGYVPGNVRLLRHGVNMMRRDMHDDDFVEMCRSVAQANAA